MEAPQSVQDHEARALRLTLDPRPPRAIADPRPVPDERRDVQICLDLRTLALIQVRADRMDAPRDDICRVLSAQVEHTPGRRRPARYAGEF